MMKYVQAKVSFHVLASTQYCVKTICEIQPAEAKNFGGGFESR